MDNLIKYANMLTAIDKETIILTTAAYVAIKLVEKNIDLCIDCPDGMHISLKFS